MGCSAMCQRLYTSDSIGELSFGENWNESSQEALVKGLRSAVYMHTCLTALSKLIQLLYNQDRGADISENSMDRRQPSLLFISNQYSGRGIKGGSGQAERCQGELLCFFIGCSGHLENELITISIFHHNLSFFSLALCWPLNKSRCAFWISNSALRNWMFAKYIKPKTKQNPPQIATNPLFLWPQEHPTAVCFIPGQAMDSHLTPHSAVSCLWCASRPRRCPVESTKQLLWRNKQPSLTLM